MRVEVAVVKMLDEARNPDASPQKLARLFDLTLTKVAHINPNGEEVLKIMQSNMLRNAISSPLKIGAMVEPDQDQPKRKRRTKLEMQAFREAQLEDVKRTKKS